MGDSYRVIVIGAGVNGLSTAWQLARAGAGPILLVEQFALGHARGSSHGKSRITRSSYHSPMYIDLVRHARAEDWPALERDAGEQLLYPTPGLFFGPDGELYRSFVEAVTTAGADVESISVVAARRRYPQFRFPDAAGVLEDRTAALVAAEATMMALARLCAWAGVEIRDGTPITELGIGADPLTVTTASGPLSAERVVVAAGPWSARLFPFLAKHVVPARQTVAYVDAGPVAADYRLGSLPVWVYLGAGDNDLWYGLPEFGRPGFKAARHVVSDRADDPDVILDEPDSAAIGEIRAFVATQFGLTDPVIAGSEHCFYSNTATEDFIIDFHPADDRVVIASGFSGHGFKFGPTTGRILADLALHGSSDVPAFAAQREVFRIPTRE
jgi:sarcosine oxidase